MNLTDINYICNMSRTFKDRTNDKPAWWKINKWVRRENKIDYLAYGLQKKKEQILDKINENDFKQIKS